MEVGQRQCPAVVERALQETRADQRTRIVREPIAAQVARTEAPAIVAKEGDECCRGSDGFRDYANQALHGRSKGAAQGGTVVSDGVADQRASRRYSGRGHGHKQEDFPFPNPSRGPACTLSGRIAKIGADSWKVDLRAWEPLTQRCDHYS